MPSIVAKDTSTTITVTCKDASNVVIDLTGATATLQYYINAYPPVFTKTMTIVDALNGVVSYQFTVSNATPPVYDVATPGILYYRVSITFANGKVLTSPGFGELTVEPSLT